MIEAQLNVLNYKQIIFYNKNDPRISFGLYITLHSILFSRFSSTFVRLYSKFARTTAGREFFPILFFCLLAFNDDGHHHHPTTMAPHNGDASYDGHNGDVFFFGSVIIIYFTTTPRVCVK